MDSFWWFLVAAVLLAILLWHVSNKIHEIRDESEAAKLQLLLTLSETRAAAKRPALPALTAEVIEDAAIAACSIKLVYDTPWEELTEAKKELWRWLAEVVLQTAITHWEEERA